MVDKETMEILVRQLNYLFYEGRTQKEWEKMVDRMVEGTELPDLRFPELPSGAEMVGVAEELLRKNRPLSFQEWLKEAFKELNMLRDSSLTIQPESFLRGSGGHERK